ncbi:MAG: BamA/TamA family outer membrane protein [bacterium]|nr:BamA/TamA family outer membrane protein [bacterium]
MMRIGVFTLFCLLGFLCLIPFAAAASENEGQPLILSIEFDGNLSIPAGELKDLMRTRAPRIFQLFNHPRYVRDWLRSDLAVLAAHYHQAGFYDVQIIAHPERDIIYDADLNGVYVKIHIIEGKRRYLNRITFEPQLEGDEEDVLRLLRLRQGAPFDPQAPGMDVFTITRSLQDEGYFAARVWYESIPHETPAHASADSIDIHFLIEHDLPARLGEIRIEGGDLPEELILREMNVERGERLRLDDILQSKQNLYDTGFFRLVNYRIEQRPRVAGAVEDVLDLVWLLRERKMAAVETGIGVGTVDGLRLVGGWSHRNLFNQGRRLSLNGMVSFKDNSEGEFGRSFEREALEYSFMRIARLRAYLSLLLFREQDYEQEMTATNLETRAIRFSAARRINPVTILKVREQFDILYQRQRTDIEVESQPNTNTRSLSLILDHDSRNDYFSPSRGTRSQFSYEIAGGLQGGDNHFHRLQWSMSRHKKITGGVLAHRLFLGTVWSFGESRADPGLGVPGDGVPFEERFYCGGGSTVRGYRDNSLGPLLDSSEGIVNSGLHDSSLPEYMMGGRMMLVANIEWRFPISIMGHDLFRGVFFFDAGNSWLNLDEININAAFPWQPGKRDDRTRIFYSMGLGFRYITPLTVIRIDYGFPLQNIGDNSGRWHLSLGQTF